MSGLKISIIGCGWLGKPLAVAFLADGHRVKGSTTTPGKLGDLLGLGIEGFHIVLGPEFHSEEFRSFFDADILVVNVPPRRRSQEFAQYISKMQQLGDAAFKGKVDHVIMVSTTSVYPDGSGDYREEDADETNDLISAEKIFSERREFATTLIRFAGLVGPGRHPGRFFAGRKAIPEGDGVVNLIHLDDCIGIIQAVVRENIWGEVFNACAKEHPTRRIFYPYALKDLRLKIPYIESGGNVRTINSEKLRNRLRYSFEYEDPLKMKFE